MNDPLLKPFIIPIFIPHFGCPHRCVFCNQAAITGATESLPSVDDISSTIDQFLTYKRKPRSQTEVSFYGGNFLGLPGFQIKEYLKKAAEFVDAGKIDGIRFSTRPDTIDKDRLELISPYPVTTIELGVQSMDDPVLKATNRGHTSADTIQAVTLLNQKNYQIGLQMMTGLPKDSETKSLDTARAIITLKPDFVRIYPTLVLEKSPLATMYEKGRYLPMTIEDCVVQLKNLYLLFQKHQIPVIRMGLQASTALDKGESVLAGPYHPALGHMVFSKIMLEQSIQLLNAKKTINDRVTIMVHPKNLSRMQGLHKNNFKILKQIFQIRTLRIETDSNMPDDGIAIC